MSEYMKGFPFAKLMDWVLTEYQNDGRVFGMERIYKNSGGDKLDIFNETIESPVGMAAGPHNQLAQNIITGYAGGSRFFELKTVQTLDGKDLPVAKPCIHADDECYNCEWSTELTVPEALEEYMKAWYALKLISKEFGLGDPDGFVFNMSAGYDYEGITSEKIDSYLNFMKNAKGHPLWKEMEDWALSNFDRFENVDEEYVRSITPQVSESITLSTLHGCPPQEIEKIASHLINEKGLNTFVKCNPTLLGYDTARKILDDLGYEYMDFDDYHFTHDLQWEDAVPMFERLQEQADAKGVAFGLKLTNTFPQKTVDNMLPSEDVYMSGRSLFPVSMELAKRIAKAFDGKLTLSFSGGVDNQNVADLFETGIWPITVATTLLKPGGYGRMMEMAEEVAPLMKDAPVKPVPEKVAALADGAKTGAHYLKGTVKPRKPKKAKESPLPLSCFTAPCQTNCPAGQNVPEYLRLMEAGKPYEALQVIYTRNPLPFITGTICSHHCQAACMRNFYDTPVKIRDAKLKAAQGAYDELLATIRPQEEKDETVAIIGAGPAGMSMASFLNRLGYPVTVFEREESAGGVVRHIIPAFRISDDAIEKDVELLRRAGVKFAFGREIKDLDELADYDYTIVATGAQHPIPYSVEGATPLDALNFLRDFRAFENGGEAPELGKHVVVVGGGNTAMDTARAAKRTPGVEDVTLVYRRSVAEMPADEEELDLAIEDGVLFMGLTDPEKLEDGLLTARVMKLGEPDESGRRRPVATEETVTMPADTLIASIGTRPDRTLFEDQKDEFESSLRQSAFMSGEGFRLPGREDVFVVGDGAGGASDVVHAIRDTQRVAEWIATPKEREELFVMSDEKDTGDYDKAKKKHGVLNVSEPEDDKTDSRCLECSTVCKACVEVCPNRANISVPNPEGGKPFIFHVDQMCNECGNCAVFCPHGNAPYKSKITLFEKAEDFGDSTNDGFAFNEDGTVSLRVSNPAAYKLHTGKDIIILHPDDDLESPSLEDKRILGLIRELAGDYSYMV